MIKKEKKKELTKEEIKEADEYLEKEYYLTTTARKNIKRKDNNSIDHNVIVKKQCLTHVDTTIIVDELPWIFSLVGDLIMNIFFYDIPKDETIEAKWLPELYCVKVIGMVCKPWFRIANKIQQKHCPQLKTIVQIESDIHTNFTTHFGNYVNEIIENKKDPGISYLKNIMEQLNEFMLKGDGCYWDDGGWQAWAPLPYDAYRRSIEDLKSLNITSIITIINWLVDNHKLKHETFKLNKGNGYNLYSTFKMYKFSDIFGVDYRRNFKVGLNNTKNKIIYKVYKHLTKSVIKYVYDTDIINKDK